MNRRRRRAHRRRMRPKSIFLVAALVCSWATMVSSPRMNAANSIVTVDSAGDVGWYTSLVLDAAANPVVSYWDAGNRDLKLVHCDDPNCAGGNESIVTVDRAGDVGEGTSVVLDAAGNPVISYYDGSNRDLKVVHCDDPNCAGGNESIVTVDSAEDVGSDTSLVLDAAGNLVVSYRDNSNGDLKVVHCDDANCAGGNESIVTVDSAGNVGSDTSLVLDAAGNPVVSYFDESNRDLKVVHCDDADCAGGNESVVTVDSAGAVGGYTSLVLDAAGNPVVSYFDASNVVLKVVHCDDPICAGGNERIVTVDSARGVGLFTSVVLDAAGNPVVSYYDAANLDLKVAHCDRAACVDVSPPVTSIGLNPGTPDGANGWYRSPVSVTVAATDDEAVAATRCVLDPAVQPASFEELPEGPCAIGTVDVDGDHVVYAASIDAAGNTGPVAQASFRVDLTAPVTSITLDPATPDGRNGWYRSPVSVTVAATDDEAVAATRCVLDPAVQPASFDALPDAPCAVGTVGVDGDHVVYAASIDTAGNTDLVQVSLRIDQTAPTASITLNPATPDGTRGWYVDPVTVAVTAQPGATLRCVTNPVTAPTSFAELPNRACPTFTVSQFGRYTVYAAAADPAGNRGPVVKRSFQHVGGHRCQGAVPTHVGTAGPDVIRGTPGPDVIVALGGDDLIGGRGGNDVICAGAGHDRIHSGAGHDRIHAQGGRDWIAGGDGDDTLTGGPARDLLFGGPGHDQLSGGAGSDVAFGGTGNDRLWGGPDHDTLFGGTGDDYLHGGTGNDLLDGGPGTDDIRGGPGHNRVITSRATAR
jgi:hypothetical protein